MHKPQLIVLLLSVTVAGILFSLPKVLVSDDKDNVLTNQSPATNTLPDSSGVHENVSSLTPVQTASVERLRNSYLNSKDNEKKINFADSLATLFAKASLFDSAATYLEAIAVIKPSVNTWLKAGNGFYDAFQFSTNPDQVGKMGEQARLYFQKVLEQKPDLLEVKSRMAMTYAATENPMQGIMLLREIVQKDPDNESANFNLGVLSMQSNQYDKAVGRFEQVLKRNPSNDQAKVYLGISYAETGQREKARQLLQSVKETNNDAVIQSTVDEYLKKLQ
jgi:tetratricopeptide (TPR) repeat protein